MAVTLKDIAARVGVKPPTVSVVLNRKKTKIAVSEKTRKRILEVAEELGYFPNAAAQALATRRTGQIGFLLSDRIKDGWANHFFAKQLEGVEATCRERGYSLSISRYNMSNIETFVVPKSVGRKSVDGLILANAVSKEIVAKIEEFDIPFVCLGQGLASAGYPSVYGNYVQCLCLCINYLVKKGHRHIALPGPVIPSWRDIYSKTLKHYEPLISSQALRLTEFPLPDERQDYSSAKNVLRLLLEFSSQDRPTAVVGSDQLCVGLVFEMEEKGMVCPEDLSLMAPAETPLCEHFRPPITALRRNLQLLGETAATMLIDHIEQETPLTTIPLEEEDTIQIIERKSVFCRTQSKV